MKLFKWRLLMPIFFLIPLFASAQEVDYNKIIPPAAMANEDFAEKLVRMAWNNYPANKAVQTNVVIAEQELQMARWSWLENIAITGNLNEFTLTGCPNEMTRERALFYPRYNIGIRLTPAMIVQIPAERRKAKENLNIAQLTVNEQKLQVRKEVLQRYQEYLMHKQLLEMEVKMLESATTEFEIQEERFKRGQVVLDEYNQSASAYVAQQRARLQAETSYIQSKLELEALIGMRLEEVR